MSKYAKVEIINTGGEYTYGVITDENEIELMKQRIEEGEEIYLNNSFEEDIEINHFEYDQVVHSYGPDVNESKVNVTIYEDEDCENEIEEVRYMDEIDDTEITTFIEDNPYLNEEDFPEGSLVFGGFYIEKRVHFPFVIELEDNEDFEESNVFIGTVLMDETLSEDEIASSAYYIRKEQQENLLKSYLGDSYSEEDSLEEYISEIIDFIREEESGYEDFKEILESCSLEIGDIEGKGESEYEYVIVKELEGDVLFESEPY